MKHYVNSPIKYAAISSFLQSLNDNFHIKKLWFLLLFLPKTYIVGTRQDRLTIYVLEYNMNKKRYDTKCHIN